MAAQIGNFPSQSGNVVFVGTTTAASQNSGGIAPTQSQANQSPSATGAGTSANQDQGSDQFSNQSMNTQSAPGASSTQGSNDSGGQDNDGQQQNNDGQQQNNDGQQQNSDGQQQNSDGQQQNNDGQQQNNDGQQQNNDGQQQNDDEGQQNDDDRQGNGNDREGNDNDRQGNGDDRQDSGSRNSDGGGGDNTIVIASVTAAVVTLVVAVILLWICFKRRKRSKYSEIIRLRPGSKDITALPVYQQDHEAAKSPATGHICGLQDVDPAVTRNPATVHICGLQDVHLDTANISDTHTRKYLSPPEASSVTPVRASLDVYNKPSTKKSSEKLQGTQGVKRHSSLPPMRQAEMVEQHPIGLSGQQPMSPTRSEKSGRFSLDNPEGRWSWTNSQAPSTPRIVAPNGRTSLTGRSVRSFRSWFSAQEDQDRPDSQQSHQRKRSNPMLLKNQAHQPVLAPRRPAGARSTSSLRMKAGRLSESLASGRRSNASHRMDDQRPLTPLAHRDG